MLMSATARKLDQHAHAPAKLLLDRQRQVIRSKLGGSWFRFSRHSVSLLTGWLVRAGPCASKRLRACVKGDMGQQSPPGRPVRTFKRRWGGARGDSACAAPGWSAAASHRNVTKAGS